MMPDMTCATCRDLLPVYRAGTLADPSAAYIAQHLMTCAPCQRVATEWDAIIATARHATQSLPPDTTSDTEWERVRARLTPRAAISPERKTMSAPVQSPSTDPNPAAKDVIPAPRRSPWGAGIAFASVIAATAIIFGLILPHLASGRQLGLKTPTPAPTATPSFSSSTMLITPGPNTTPITGIGSYADIQRAATGPVTPKNPTSIIQVNGFVYIVMSTTTHVHLGDTITARWFFNTVDITNDLLITKPDCCSQRVTDDGKALQILFAIKVPQVGVGQAQIYYNQRLAYTVVFKVVEP